MDENIFCAIRDNVELFIRKYNLNYDFKEQYVEVNDKIKGRNYKTYNQIWSNISLTLEVNFKITSYTDSNSKSLIYIHIYKYKELELQKWIDIGDYLKQKRNISIMRLEDYSGETIDEKIVSFFIWFEKNIDKKLINIIKGKGWVDTHLDWREKLDNLKLNKGL